MKFAPGGKKRANARFADIPLYGTTRFDFRHVDPIYDAEQRVV
jgi:hypothetical protein